MQPFSYIRPASAWDAVSAFVEAGEGARFIAGGTTLYDLMKLDIERPRHLIDLTAIHGLDRIETAGDHLRFEALAPMSAVAAHPLVSRDYPVLAEALSKAASQQLRNMATIAGNLLQRTRCMYFRNGAHEVFPCNKREPGSGCAAIGLASGAARYGFFGGIAGPGGDTRPVARGPLSAAGGHAAP
jgi:xanthine dehydrogenase YagS FAD-binding subunit